MRNVVVDEEAGEAHSPQSPHHLDRVDVAFANEAFLELRHRAFDVPKMDVEDLSARAEELDRLDDAFTHLRPAAHAEVEAVVRAWRHLDDASPKPFEAPEQTGDAAKRFNRRIIRVKGQLNV